ncbi:hypothetical protein LC607_26835 [Nostoc sp. CHAB 5824]|nr:hypothetical protein [Nostoc sp. CHAB 5824]
MGVGNDGKSDRTTPEFNKRSARLDKGDYKTAMSTTGYANALTLEFSQKGDRTNKSYKNLDF